MILILLLNININAYMYNIGPHDCMKYHDPIQEFLKLKKKQ